MLTTTSTLQNLKHGGGRCSDQGDPGEPGAVREEASPHREVAGQATLQISSWRLLRHHQGHGNPVRQIFQILLCLMSLGQPRLLPFFGEVQRWIRVQTNIVYLYTKLYELCLNLLKEKFTYVCHVSADQIETYFQDYLKSMRWTPKMSRTKTPRS